MRRPAPPRDAASLVLVKPTDGGLAFLMGRRPPRSPFMPDAFVFPGGKVDPIDAHVRSPFRLVPESQASLLRVPGVTPRRARALANAAIRETFEETGLLLARDADFAGPDADTWATFRGLGQAPDASQLRFLGRAITPTSSPTRYHARFFVAWAASTTGALRPNEELLDLAWYPYERIRDLPIVDVTRVMLDAAHRLARDGTDPLPQPAATTRVTYRNDRIDVRLEEHREISEAPPTALSPRGRDR